MQPDRPPQHATPAVSVVLPVYNGARTIAATVSSVLQQAFADFELLVIDDGSTDDTPAILAGLQDPRLQVHSFDNRGLAASRNRGVRLARGRYVAFIDADDLWTPDKLARQVAGLIAEPAAALVYSLTDCIDEHGRHLGPGSHCQDSGQVYERLLVSNFLDNGSTPLIRREVFDELGLFDETLPAAEDWDLWLRIAHRYPFACVQEPQVLYRVHSGAMSSRIQRQEAACLRVLDAGLSRLPPSAQRDRLERQGLTNLYRYLAGRVVGTSTDRRSVPLAYRYVWRYLRLAPAPREVLLPAIAHLGSAMLLTLLPHAIARPLLARIKALLPALASRGR